MGMTVLLFLICFGICINVLISVHIFEFVLTTRADVEILMKMSAKEVAEYLYKKKFKSEDIKNFDVKEFLNS